MVDQVKNVSSFCLGFGSIKNLDKIIYEKFTTNSNVYFFIDEFFKDKNIFNHIFDKIYNKKITYISTENEPTTAFVNNLSKQVKIRDKYIDSWIKWHKNTRRRSDAFSRMFRRRLF